MLLWEKFVVVTVKALVAEDKAYRFMNNIKGTPAYWKKVSLWSTCNGKPNRASKILHVSELCRPKVEWTDFYIKRWNIARARNK